MSPADSFQSSDRRRYPRLSEERLFVYRKRGHANEFICFTRNVGGEGLMFESPQPIPPDAQLEVEFYAPVDCEKRTRLHMLIGAQVQWTSEILEAFNIEGANRYRVGVAFDQIDTQDQACLVEYVKKRLMMASAQHAT